MKLRPRRIIRNLSAVITASLVLAACAVGGSNGSSGSSSSGACSKYDSAILDNRPVPASVDPSTVTPSASDLGANNTANLLGAPQALNPVLWSSIKVTKSQVTAICNKHLTAVFLDWSNVTY